MISTARKAASPDDAQFTLFDGVPAREEARLLQTALTSGRRFVTGDAHAIFLGTTRLETYLRQPVADMGHQFDTQQKRQAANRRALRPGIANQCGGLDRCRSPQGAQTLFDMILESYQVVVFAPI